MPRSWFRVVSALPEEGSEDQDRDTFKKGRYLMKARYCYAAVLAFALLVTTGAWAQGHKQFDDHDRQVTRDWNSQHQKHAARGLRSQDRLTPDLESRLQPGRPFDKDLRKHAYSIPSDLKHRLPPPPPHHVYMVIGGDVVLVDSVNHILLDIIRLH